MWLRPHFEAADNLLRFDRFMERALYDPDHGYYASRIEAVGARGDFSTSATLSDLLARGIASWLADHAPAHVIEVGPGSGQLARAILRLSRPPGLLRHLRPPPFTYHLVERSPILREQQRRLLGRTARWHQCVEDALTAADGHAFLFSNELIDAFPVRVFRCDGTVPDGTGPEAASWSELHLQLAARQLAETWLPSGTLPDSAVFSHQWPAGQRVEVHESAHDWLARWQTHWKSGELLTIDYGGHSPDLYRRAPAGTLRAYYHHERLTGPDVYTLAGRRDLTADVNFDDLQRWGVSLGLRTHSLITQRDFLFPHLDPDHSSVADRFLTDADGPGTSFKVLRQRKGNP